MIKMSFIPKKNVIRLIIWVRPYDRPLGPCFCENISKLHVYINRFGCMIVRCYNCKKSISPEQGLTIDPILKPRIKEIIDSKDCTIYNSTFMDMLK